MLMADREEQEIEIIEGSICQRASGFISNSADHGSGWHRRRAEQH